MSKEKCGNVSIRIERNKDGACTEITGSLIEVQACLLQAIGNVFDAVKNQDEGLADSLRETCIKALQEKVV